MAYLVLRPAHGRALAGPLRSVPIAPGGRLPGAALGILSALVLYLAIELGLGLDAEDALATVGLSILAILTFSAMAHLCKFALGTPGSLLLVVLLMLQLTSAGGLYPVETTPEFFQALHPLLPMSYVVDALRVTIGGGEASLGVRGCSSWARTWPVHSRRRRCWWRAAADGGRTACTRRSRSEPRRQGHPSWTPAPSSPQRSMSVLRPSRVRSSPNTKACSGL